MKREFAQLAHVANPEKNYNGWYVSRKLNGWGCMWDGGITRGMVAKNVPWYYEGGDSRLKDPVISTGLWTIGRADKHGIRPKVINAPSWWLDRLPTNVPLQGELWHDDDLAYVKSVCGQGSKGKVDDRWSNIQYVVYNSKPYSLWQGYAFLSRIKKLDISPNWVNNSTWLYRFELLQELYRNTVGFNTVSFVLGQSKIKNDLYDHFRVALDLGWEGLMIANPFSNYEDYRSHNLLKLKPEFETEAAISGATEGEKRHNGRMGALEVNLIWDEKVVGFTGGTQDMVGKYISFKIGGGFSDEQREWDYVRKYFSVGKKVNFTFLGVSKDGIPQSPNYKGVVE